LSRAVVASGYSRSAATTASAAIAPAAPLRPGLRGLSAHTDRGGGVSRSLVACLRLGAGWAGASSRIHLLMTQIKIKG
jgi:hypothetical protein